MLYSFVLSCASGSQQGDVAGVYLGNYFAIPLALTVFGVPVTMLTLGGFALFASSLFPVCMRRHSGRSHKF